MTIEELAALATIATPPDHPVRPTAELLRELAGAELIEPCEQGYQLAERGRVFLNHVLALPLPEQAWHMPAEPSRAAWERDDPRPGIRISGNRISGARVTDLHSPSADSAADEEGPAPPPPPKPKPIPNVTPAATVEERRVQARNLIALGTWGTSEIAETLEMEQAEVEQIFFGGA